MENQEILITVAIILALAYFYWQNQQKSLNIQSGENDTELKELQNQVNHYQKLYQSRVEKDLTNESLLNGQSLTEIVQQRNNYQKIQPLFEQKITDLENSLLSLAKQKIKGEKEFQKVVEQLETNLKQDKETWQVEQKKLLANCETNYNLAQSQLTQLKTYQSEQVKFEQELTKQQQAITELNQTLLAKDKEIQELHREKEQKEQIIRGIVF